MKTLGEGIERGRTLWWYSLPAMESSHSRSLPCRNPVLGLAASRIMGNKCLLFKPSVCDVVLGQSWDLIQVIGQLYKEHRRQWFWLDVCWCLGRMAILLCRSSLLKSQSPPHPLLLTSIALTNRRCQEVMEKGMRGVETLPGPETWSQVYLGGCAPLEEGPGANGWSCLLDIHLWVFVCASSLHFFRQQAL